MQQGLHHQLAKGTCGITRKQANPFSSLTVVAVCAESVFVLLVMMKHEIMVTELTLCLPATETNALTTRLSL